MLINKIKHKAKINLTLNSLKCKLLTNKSNKSSNLKKARIKTFNKTQIRSIKDYNNKKTTSLLDYKNNKTAFLKSPNFTNTKLKKSKGKKIPKNKKNYSNKNKSIKMDKLLSENEYLKSLIEQVEKRLEHEMDKRLKQEFENKYNLDQKISLFKDEIRNDEK